MIINDIVVLASIVYKIIEEGGGGGLKPTPPSPGFNFTSILDRKEFIQPISINTFRSDLSYKYFELILLVLRGYRQ